MDVREALYTTRAMRRLAPDPVPDEVLMRILDAAIRAPSAGNAHAFRFLVVRDADTKKALQVLYREALDELYRTRYARAADAVRAGTADPSQQRVTASANHLADSLHTAPVLLFAYGLSNGASSVFPAVWSACLAARAEGLGSTVTTLLKARRAEVDALLGRPPDSEYEMFAMIPIGRPLGRWGVAQRRPLHEMVYTERWACPPDWNCDRPLWPEPEGAP
ncbi:nitroreductase family protein [Sporichthya brevicatena]|uniref:Nitroreductase family protein n=1 Tax=Sporichthya brevicatena TaxID=171442 RepID=A0ABN1GRD6_9ACTN